MPARLHVSPSPLHGAAAPHPTLHEKVCRNIVLWLHITCPMSLSKPPKTKGLAAVALGLGVDPATKSCTGPAPGPGPSPPGPPPPPRPPVPAGQCSAPMDGMSLVYGDSKKPSSYPTTDTAEACVVRVSPSPRLPVSPFPLRATPRCVIRTGLSALICSECGGGNRHARLTATRPAIDPEVFGVLGVSAPTRRLPIRPNTAWCGTQGRRGDGETPPAEPPLTHALPLLGHVFFWDPVKQTSAIIGTLQGAHDLQIWHLARRAAG